MSKIVTNSIFLTGSQIIARAIGFLYLIFLGRQLGVEQFGIYAFTISLVYNFVPVADFGIERLTMRDIARQPDKAQEYFSKLALLKVISSLLSVVLLFGLGIILGLKTYQVGYIFIFSLGLVPIGLGTLIVAIAAAKERMKVMSIANIMLIGCYAFYGLIAYFISRKLIFILLAYPLANTTILIFLLINSWRWGLSLKFVFDPKFYWSIIKQSWIFGLINIGAVFYLRLTIILAGVYFSAQELGYYSSVFKFIDAGILIPQAIALALFPISSRLSQESPKQLKLVYIKSWLSLFCLGLMAVVFINLLADKIIYYTYGQAYLPAVPALRVLSLAVVLFFVNAIPGNVIQTNKKVGLFLPLMLFNYLITLLIGLRLVTFGAIGVAWTVVIGEIIGLVVNNLLVFYLLRKIKNE